MSKFRGRFKREELVALIAKQGLNTSSGQSFACAFGVSDLHAFYPFPVHNT